MALFHLGKPNDSNGECYGQLAAYLYRYHKFHWVASIPAWFITTVCATYLYYNPIGFHLDYQLSVYLGLATTVVCIILFFTLLKPFGDRDEEAYVNN